MTPSWPPHVRTAYDNGHTISQDDAGRWLVDGELAIPRVADPKPPTDRCPRCSAALTIDREDDEPTCLFCGYRAARAPTPHEAGTAPGQTRRGQPSVGGITL